MPPITLLDALAVATLIALAISFNHRHQRSQLPYPPGPRGFPIIGHFLTFPKNFVWLAFTEWGQKYGMECPFLNVLCADVGRIQGVSCPSNFWEK